jgi:hypothetical protein
MILHFWANRCTWTACFPRFFLGPQLAGSTIGARFLSPPREDAPPPRRRVDSYEPSRKKIVRPTRFHVIEGNHNTQDEV